MLAIRLSDETELRLDALAKQTGRTKTFYAREAILTHFEDLEDLEDYYSLSQNRKSQSEPEINHFTLDLSDKSQLSLKTQQLLNES